MRRTRAYELESVSARFRRENSTWDPGEVICRILNQIIEIKERKKSRLRFAIIFLICISACKFKLWNINVSDIGIQFDLEASGVFRDNILYQIKKNEVKFWTHNKVYEIVDQEHFSHKILWNARTSIKVIFWTSSNGDEIVVEEQVPFDFLETLTLVKYWTCKKVDETAPEVHFPFQYRLCTDTSIKEEFWTGNKVDKMVAQKHFPCIILWDTDTSIKMELWTGNKVDEMAAQEHFPFQFRWYKDTSIKVKFWTGNKVDEIAAQKHVSFQFRWYTDNSIMEKQKSRLRFTIIFPIYISDSLINGIKADDKLQKSHYKSLCSIYDCLFHGHKDPSMMYFLSIPIKIKMKRKIRDVAFAVACQMLFH